MQKYVLIHNLKPIVKNTQFSMYDWPLHLTLSPRFAVDIEQKGFDADLSNLITKQKPFKTTVKNDEYFGLESKIHVSLLDLTPQLFELHNELLDLLESYGAVFDEPNYSRSGYIPHVTVQKSGRVFEGDIIKINSLSLVDMFPDGDIKQRKVLKNYKFKND
ncbi:MAG TPA: 2'-5' RNA ligase family protein [Candidatus Saccharibacteria bacterium]|nr:2'-5' RNA ligase family protein [Candidatus Saccharibacteria bacterium]